MYQSQRTVLLIDDNAADRHVLKRYLQRDLEHDYVFVEAETGEMGLEQCHAKPPTCILVDYNLPDMSGLELLAELTGKSQCPQHPIVMMTGAGDETIAVQAIQGGAQNYLVKGNLTPEGLLIVVDDAIEKVRLRQNLEMQQQHLQQQNKELQHRQQEIQALNIRLQRAMTESHHRIKNNLQTLASLVNLYTMENTEFVPRSALTRLEQHLKTLASLHDLLTQEAKSEGDFDTINLKASLDQLAPIIQATAGGRQVQITADEVRLPLKQGSAFLLLANELLANALKHGKGAVQLSLSVKENKAYLEVADEGAGFPISFDARKAANTGMELIDSIGRHDLRGILSYENRPEGGARVVVTFPVPLQTR